jgi:hypothetical protein
MIVAGKVEVSRPQVGAIYYYISRARVATVPERTAQLDECDGHEQL